MTFELKCEGLTVEQLATCSVPPSTMSLLGMIRHLARVEHSWTPRPDRQRGERHDQFLVEQPAASRAA